MKKSESQRIIEIIHKTESRAMHNVLPVVWKTADKEIVTDTNNKKYIDFTSGICVTNAGHGNPKIWRAIMEEATEGLLHSYTFYTKERADFLEYLIKHTPKFIEKAFLVSAGTEATEAAIKLMKMYGMQKFNRNKKIIISFEGAMHGRTMLSEQLRGRNENNKWAFNTHSTEVCLIEFPKKDAKFNPDDIFYNTNTIAGIIIESYQGWSARFYPKQYMKDLVKWCKKNNILVCFDEIQSGMGRTGKLFNYMHYEVQPDLICVGKGFTSSLPMSGVLGRKDILDIPEEGSMSSTHSANPLCCAIGLANFKEIKKLLPDVERKGKLLYKGLKKLFSKYEINGKGLLYGIITPSEKYATKVCLKAMKKGLLLIKTGRESIKIAPPLCVSDINIKKGLKILEEVR